MRLRTLGGVGIDGARRALSGAAVQRRPLALLAVLAAAGDHGVSREKLLALLWPESDADHARNALRQTLYALRRDLAAPELFVGGEEIKLNLTVMATDLDDFSRGVTAGDLDAALTAYGGPFLDGFHVNDAPEFERWAQTERARLAARFAEAAESLARAAATRGDLQRAADYWRRLAAQDPFNSRVALELMRALADAGDRAGAIRHARIHEALLREELDAAPDAAIVALAERLRSASEEPVTVRPFVAEVESNEGSVSQRLPEVTVATDRVAVAEPHPSQLVSRARSRMRRFVRPALTIMSLGIVMVATSEWQPRRALEPSLVAVAPYDVYDPSLELWREGLMDILSHTLDGAGPLRTVPPSVTARRSMRGAHRVASEELARRTGAGIVVSGYLMRVGADSVRVMTSVVEATSGRAVEVEQRESFARMDRLVDSLTLMILREVDEWIAIGAVRHSALGRPKSMEALKDFLRGEQFYRRSQWDSAHVAYTRVLAHDTSFALAFRRLGEVIGWQRLMTDSLAEAYKLRAGALNRGLSPRDSLLVLADSLEAATSRLATPLEEWPYSRRLFATLREGVRRYPDDPEMWYALGEARYHIGYGPVLGVSPRETLDAFDRAIELDSAFGPAYVHTPELALETGGPSSARRYIDAYLRHHRGDRAERFIRLLAGILAPGATPSAEVEQLPETTPAEDISSMRTATRHWPDSGEIAVQLARRLAAGGHPSRFGTFQDQDLVARLLAEQLAFRGHLREARRVIGARDEAIAFELAYISAGPDSAPDDRVERLVAAASSYSSMALPSWAVRGDSANIHAFLEGARARIRDGSTELARLAASYDTAAAQAYLALLRRDTATAIRRFGTLPDTLCARCYIDRLTRASLLSARGRHREALTDLAEPLTTIVSPIEVLFRLERGRVAERLGDRRGAAEAYQFVVDVWGRGDPEVQPLVADARRRLARVRGARR